MRFCWQVPDTAATEPLFFSLRREIPIEAVGVKTQVTVNGVSVRMPTSSFPSALWAPVRWWLTQVRFMRAPERYEGPINVFRATWHEAALHCELLTGASICTAAGNRELWGAKAEIMLKVVRATCAAESSMSAFRRFFERSQKTAR